MYIAQAFKFQYAFWRYLIGIFIVAIGLTIGQAPLTYAMFLEEGFNMFEMSQAELLGLLEPNFSLFLLMLSYAVGLAALLFAVKYLHEQSLLSLTTSRKKTDWKRVIFSFLITAIIIVGGILIGYLLEPESFQWNFNLVPFLILLAIAVIFIPVQTSFEEYLFRGYLMQGIGTLAGNKWVPLLVTSLIFGGLHIGNPEVATYGYFIMANYIGIGLFLGIITLMDEGLELALGFHAANNLFIALLLTSENTAFQTHSVFKDISTPELLGWEVFIEILIIYPIVLGIFAKKYGWKNWKNKLFGKVEKSETLKLSEEP
ncbi:CPBP family intramembrane glutamic endopeptidase [Salegentibacter sp. F188]|uniref:CPBP family intramembrane glutamic endopeptidase n=1 Tax=Autumnicola patrickiae TaxID=3075591 RepID=A0ABU3DYH4_9FLAO|nr:CPBP family intramembrane glutamic endopeptidase [Salegentibacter sp. F188]MDT0688499.1 CPBP family intramembrane glutamic endopeptidase [Salegentibacter sp. F188]